MRVSILLFFRKKPRRIVANGVRRQLPAVFLTSSGVRATRYRHVSGAIGVWAGSGERWVKLPLNVLKSHLMSKNKNTQCLIQTRPLTKKIVEFNITALHGSCPYERGAEFYRRPFRKIQKKKKTNKIRRHGREGNFRKV